MRKDKRKNDELRPVKLERGFQPHAFASNLISVGGTRVICALTVEDAVPPFLKDSGRGWLTAEYGMLPCATHTRNAREAARGRGGRTYEIQRLIGRSLRAMLDLGRLGERTLRLDCDVIAADGGTRTASISAAALAVRDAVGRLRKEKLLPDAFRVLPLAAVSVGLVDGEPLLDLDYTEDAKAEVDANFVMTGDGRLVEVQCSAEGRPFSRREFDDLAGLAWKGIKELLDRWWDI